MSYTLQFTLPGLPDSTNSARKKHSHWTVRLRHDNAWKLAVWAACNQNRKPPKPLKKAKVTLTRYSSSKLDYEGLVSTFKPILDGLTESNVIVDDEREVIGIPDYLWAYAKPNQGYIEVRVEEIIETTSVPIAETLSCAA